MENKILKNNLINVLARVEGTIKINEQGNPVRVHTKLQGIRDKLIYVINKIDNSDGKSDSEKLKEQIQITVGTKNESD